MPPIKSASENDSQSKLPQGNRRGVFLRGGHRFSRPCQCSTPCHARGRGYAGTLELHLKLELYSTWEDEIASASGGRKVAVIHLSKSRIIRVEIGGPVPNVPIEGIEEVGLEENVTCFRYLRSLQQVEVFAQIR